MGTLGSDRLFFGKEFWSCVAGGLPRGFVQHPLPITVVHAADVDSGSREPNTAADCCRCNESTLPTGLARSATEITTHQP
jgi:hypothetical protein